jgi:H2-forming N5,N10-methylenetetrahydromethanopterin dehydrogenase-like enzyme
LGVRIVRIAPEGFAGATHYTRIPHTGSNGTIHTADSGHDGLLVKPQLHNSNKNILRPIRNSGSVYRKTFDHTRNK